MQAAISYTIDNMGLGKRQRTTIAVSSQTGALAFRFSTLSVIIIHYITSPNMKHKHDLSKSEVKMRKIVISIFTVLLLAAATFSLIQIALGQGSVNPNVVNTETQGENIREIQSPYNSEVPQQPNIGFIDSPSATCYQPNSLVNQCFINWYYLSVSAAPNYMITMTLTMNATGPIAHTQGFFQTSMYIPYNMLGKGFQVKCGAAGAGGNPTLGNAYAYTVRARDSAGLSSANYGTVYCPAYP